MVEAAGRARSVDREADRIGDEAERGDAQGPDQDEPADAFPQRAPGLALPPPWW